MLLLSLSSEACCKLVKIAAYLAEKFQRHQIITFFQTSFKRVTCDRRNLKYVAPDYFQNEDDVL